ncbi:AAA domain containing protein [uncultured Caudovirales phage]|uniref:AAA domain containing protein n=1 Tax=uncultured Caudovirales phage TaxID=2100421 RepID=A0A6J5L174_9CAUD|nr:AAA domain containing protein [uncultured Caudovirales phage]
MFATILQKETPVGIMQVVVVPMQDGSTRQFYRTGKNMRGTVGAWVLLGDGEAITTEGMAVGEPVAIPITVSDYRDLQYPIIPTTLVQKLSRTVKEANTPGPRTFAEVYEEVTELASNNPSMLLAKFGYKYQATATLSPTIQVVQEPAPAVQEPSFAVASMSAIREHFAPEVSHPTTESEPLMEFSTIVPPTMTDSHAVLTIPEVEPYFPRSFFGKTEYEMYDYAVHAGEGVLLTGDAGTGKTSSVRNYAAMKGLPFVTIECTQQIDQSITQGRFVPTGVGNSTRWKYSQLATAIQQPSVILINELSRMSPKAAPLFLRLLAERELLIEPLNEVIKVHPSVLFVADQNVGLGYNGTQKQDNALLDRFHLKLEFHYDTKIEGNFIPSQTLLAFASNIREAAELNDEFSIPMSTRILKNFVAQARGLNLEFAINSMLSNYPKMDGERDAIKMRLDADVSQIASELGVPVGKYSI